MIRILSIPIQYKGEEFYALVRFTPKEDCTQVRVTIMNGNVEKLLCGNNIFKYTNGSIVDDVETGSKESDELRLIVADALQKHIGESDVHESGNGDIINQRSDST